MRPGTPGFIGARLTEAREARGFTVTSLSELIGVSKQAVSQYEKGSASPHPEAMQGIVEALHLPLEFFLRPTGELTLPTVFYRSLSAATKAERARADRRFGWLREVVCYVRAFVELPPANLPNLGLPGDPNALVESDLEGVASEIRRFWNLGDGPISNVVWLLENNGVVVARDELGSEALDAFSAWVDGTPYVFLGSDKGSAARSRLDAAHELAHLLLHRGVDRSQLYQQADHRLLEDQAFRFAGAFLLPASSFARDFYVPTLDALRVLKSKWAVSVGMMIKRAEDLTLISPDQARRLWISYNRRGWKRKEPLDDELPIEQPRLLRRSMELIVNEAGQSHAHVLSELPFAVSDVEELASLPPGSIGDVPPPVRLIDLLAHRSDSNRSRGSGPGDIVNFPNTRDGR